MKCLKNITITLSFAIAVTLPAVGAAEDLWSMKELSVLTFYDANVDIEADEDERGVRMRFKEWNRETEQQIRHALADTDIQYRLFPNQQAAMTVELFSTDASLKFNKKKQKRTVQIIVGNSRPELNALNVLLDPENTVPLPKDTLELIKKGDIVGARKAFYLEESTEPQKKRLTQNRILVLEAALRNSEAARCNPLFGRAESPEAIEATFLTSWCEFSRGRTDEAEEILAKMRLDIEEAPENDKDKKYKKVLKRIESHRKKILVYSLLNYAREDNTPILSNTFARFADEYLNKLFSVNLLEITAEHLIRLGLGKILTRYSDKIMARLNNDELKQSAPVIAEAYLDARQYVKAQDAASYFLEKPLPPWAEGRLLRVRAYVHLQEGNWQSAIRDFSAAYELIIPSPSDEMALIEARIRAEQTPRTELELPSESDSPVYRVQKRFIERLNTEIRLKDEKSVSNGALMTLPDHVLYYALQNALAKKDSKLARRVSKILNDRKSSWAVLAKIESRTKEMKTQLNKLNAKGNTP